MNLAPLMSSAKDDWQTPDEVLDLVRQLGPIGLDPCTTDDNPTRANCFYTPESNGLSKEWSEFGLVYVNPPYGRHIGHWAAKAVDESTLGTDIVMLLPARTDTRWWQAYVVEADSVCFWRGRLVFKGAPDPAPFPSAIAYWGERSKAFGRVFAPHGWVVKP